MDNLVYFLYLLSSLCSENDQIVKYVEIRQREYIPKRGVFLSLILVTCGFLVVPQFSENEQRSHLFCIYI